MTSNDRVLGVLGFVAGLGLLLAFQNCGSGFKSLSSEQASEDQEVSTMMAGDIGKKQPQIDGTPKSQPSGAEYNRILSVNYLEGTTLTEAAAPFTCGPTTCTGYLHSRIQIVYELSESYYQMAISSFANGRYALGVSAYSFGFFTPDWTSGLRYDLGGQEKFSGEFVVWRLIPNAGECSRVSANVRRCTQVSDFRDGVARTTMNELKLAQNIRVATRDNGVVGDPFVRLHHVNFGSSSGPGDDSGQVFDEKPLRSGVAVTFNDPPPPVCEGTRAKWRSDRSGQAAYLAPDSPQGYCVGSQQQVRCMYSTGSSAAVGTRADSNLWLCDSAVIENRNQGVWLQCDSTRRNQIVGSFKCLSSGWAAYNPGTLPPVGGGSSAN